MELVDDASKIWHQTVHVISHVLTHAEHPIYKNYLKKKLNFMTTHTLQNTLDLAPGGVGLYKPAEYSNVIKTLCPQLAGSRVF